MPYIAESQPSDIEFQNRQLNCGGYPFMRRRSFDLDDLLFHRREALVTRQIKGGPEPAGGAAFSRREILAGMGIAACGLASGCAGAESVHVPSGPDMAGGPQVALALQLTNAATNREIEGYASATSVNRDEDIRLYVNTNEPSYTIEALRLGWYGGQGSRSMMQPVTVPGEKQEDPVIQAGTGLIECNWQNPYVLHIPQSVDPKDWPSGIYVAKLTASASGKQSYIPFVVRDDSRASDVLFQCSVNTYQAYNEWGGRSLYTSPRAYAVSFNRPYAGEFGLGDLLSYEFHMVRFLESQGYDVTYTTNVETHSQGELLRLHKAFLSVGHDEYWTWQMRDQVETARNLGVNLGFFGANACYWQIRYERSPVTQERHRTIVCFKEQSADPMSHVSSSKHLTTVKFRTNLVGRREDTLIGQMWETWPVQGDMVITDTTGWVFDCAGLNTGDHLPGLLGYEVDRMWDRSPAGTYRVARSPYKHYGDTRYSDMTVYRANSGARVVATGTMQWNWGLSDVQIAGISYECDPAKRATHNILQRFGALPGSPVAAVSQ
jgi:hypothetical protein